MRFRVLDAAVAADRAAWKAAWEESPAREPAAHPAYAALFARPCDRVVCAAGTDAGGTILFPLVLRPLKAEPWARADESRWDATTPYGYGGPFAWGPGPRDDAAFWREHAQWCGRERVATTFVRLSLFPDQLASLPAPAEERLVNIVIPLAEGADAVWAGYDRTVRKAVKDAREAGLTVEIDEAGERVEEFFSVYTHTMTRRGAADWYFFGREFFTRLIAELPGLFVFVHALKDGKVVWSSLELRSRDYLYAFLGGTLEEAFELGPNHLLKHESAVWGAARGLKGFVLGGGHAPGDGIFRYKRAYAKTGETPFRVLCLTHDVEACADLSRDRAVSEAAGGREWTARPGYFPPYRG